MKALEQTQHDADGGEIWPGTAQLLFDSILYPLHALGHAGVLHRCLCHTVAVTLVQDRAST